MKKSLRFCVLLALAAALLTVSAFADTGPKPQLTVKVTNPPEELYYLDLLAEGDWEHAGDADYSGLDWSYSEEEIAALDSGLLDALRAAVPDGWHACTAEGTNGAPMWGDLLGEDAGNGTRLHTFGYVGVPDTYRILLVTQSGETWLSGTYTRRSLQSSVTVDWASKTVDLPPVWAAYLLQFLCTLLPTLLMEGALLFIFGYRSRKSWRSFLVVNLVTQGGFAAYLAVSVMQNGANAWMTVFFYLPIEIVITLAELLLYRWLLTEKSKSRAAVYAIAANICSAAFGLWLIDPLWHFLVTIT